MEKIKVNNQIVLMRKSVKQAKVRTINKLTKEVKLLQDRKGNETQVAKAKRKAERFLEEIALMKKIKPDYVSKLALSKTSDWNDILKQKTSTLNDRCISMLASYKAVQDEVEKFYSSNPDIVPKIPDLIKEWEQKSKLMKNLPKGRKAPDIKKRRIDKNMKKMYSEDKLNSTSSISDQKVVERTNALSENRKNLPNEKIDESGEENNDFFQETQEIECDSSFVNKQEYEKQKKGDKQRALRLTERNNVLFENRKSLPNEKTDESEEEENDDSFQETQEVKNNSSLFSNKEYKKQKKGGKQRVEKLNSVESQNEISDIQLSEDSESDENSIEEESGESCSDNEGLIENLPKNLAYNIDGNKTKDSDHTFDETSDVENKVNETTFRNKKSPIKDASSDIHKKKHKKRRLSNDHNINSSPMQSDYTQSSEFNLNHKKSGGKSSKAIALINLNELEDLDEIPLDKFAENENEESEEEERKELSEKKIHDPFFLGSEELDSASNDISAKSKNLSSFSKYDQRKERDMPFSRREKSFPNNFKKSFQNSSSHAAFSRNELPKFNHDRSKSFKRDQFQSNYQQDRFQSERKFGFRKDEFHLNRKERRSQMFGRKPQKRHSDKPYARNESSDSFRKDKAAGKKGNDADGKPLHPSWEAKKKLKELTQTGFQGKRMVFNDN